MNIREAIQILDQAASLAPLNRQAHVQVQTAIATLTTLVDSQEAQKESTKEASKS